MAMNRVLLATQTSSTNIRTGSKDRLDIHADLEALSERIDDLEEVHEEFETLRDEMIHPQAARMVLEHTGISEAQAADLVETMQEVDRQIRDADVV